MTVRTLMATAVLAIVATACSSGSTATPGASAAATAAPPATQSANASETSSSAAAPSAASSAGAGSLSPAEAWAADLDQLDRAVRSTHPLPWVNRPESEWVARIAQLKTSLPTMSRNDAVVAVMGLVALLDTHSGVAGEDNGFHFYGLVPYWFADGMYVVAAQDPSLVGSRIDAIGTTPIDAVIAKLTPYVNADNESALHDGLPVLASVPEVLHALGIVPDESKPDYQLTTPGGKTVTADPAPLTTDDYVAAIPSVVNGPLEGSKPEAVSRRGEPIWSERIPQTNDFYIAYNATGTDATSTIAAMRAALDTKSINRVILDLRYARGGNASKAADLIEALVGDKRINRPGGLAILIGRESISATTALASMLEQQSEAFFVGEPTPARPNTLLGADPITLEHSGIVVYITGTLDPIAGPSDTRTAIRPKVAVALTAADFFVGKDPALDAAIKAP